MVGAKLLTTTKNYFEKKSISAHNEKKKKKRKEGTLLCKSFLFFSKKNDFDKGIFLEKKIFLGLKWSPKLLF